MGSFAYTCCISGLPIHGGDPVRYFLLTQHPFYKKIGDACTMTGIWMPRTFPLIGVYDDYGRAEGIEDGPEKYIWLEAFQYDLIERGTGDNSVHDVPVRKSMNFEDLMLAIQESRLRVKMVSVQAKRLSKSLKETKRLLGADLPDILKSSISVDPSIPTIKRVRRILKKAGIKVSDQGFNDGYLVNRKTFGTIRVRSSRTLADPVSTLVEIQPILDERFSTEVVEDSGVYSRGPSLLVIPKQGTDFLKDIQYLERTKRLTVAQAMVREDVWQALLAIDPVQVLEFYKQAGDMWTSLRGDISEARRLGHDPIEGNMVSAWVRDEHGVGLMSHYLLMLDQKPTEESRDKFLATVAETVFIQSILSSTRYQYRPSTSVGPQFGEWGQHVAFLRALTGVAEQCYAAEQEDLDDGSEHSV